jgi:uncharacterized protein YjiS (DUF1127 family)
MALIDTLPHAAHARPSGLVAGIFSLLGSVAAAREAARVYAELDALSDTALAARGLKRTDIAAVAARELRRA